MIKDIILKSWQILEPKNKKDLYFLVLYNFIVVILELLTLGLLANILKLFTDYKSSENLAFLHKLKFYTFDNINLLTFLFIIFFLIYITKVLFLIFFYNKQFKFTFNLKAQLTSKVFQHYLLSPYIFHLKNSSNLLLRNITSEVSLISTGVIHQIIVLGTEILIIMSIIIFLFFVNSLIISVLVFFFLVVGLLYYLITKEKLLKLGNERQTISTDVIKRSLNSLHGIKDIKILGKENYFHNMFKESSYDLAIINKIISVFAQIPKLTIEVTLIILISLFAIKISDVNQIVETLGLILFGGLRMMPSVSRILTAFQNLKYNFPAMDVVFKELKSANKFLQNNSSSQMNEKVEFNKSIEFKNVNFNYDKNKTVFDNLNLTINRGDIIGISGESGDGKSTFVDLLVGLLKPEGGKIIIDGKELNEKNACNWRSKIGYVPQKVYLIDDTVVNNIALGVPEKDINYKRISEIIKITNLSNLRSIGTDVSETTVGDRGKNLSGGEMQRIGIARSLYIDCEILILDESTNSLDEANEKLLIDTVHKLFKDKTVIMISHKNNLFYNCNKCFELKNKSFVQINK